MMSLDELTNILTALMEEYPPGSYDVLHKNCCHFASDLCFHLGVDGIPDWVHRFSDIAAKSLDVLAKSEEFLARIFGAEKISSG